MSRKRRIPATVRSRVSLRAIRHVGVPCEARLPGVHDDTARVEFHHRRMWARGGRHTYPNLVALCLPCHRFVHSPDGRRWAIRLGLLTLHHPRRFWRRSEQLPLLELMAAENAGTAPN